MSEEAPTIFEQYPVASWEVEGAEAITFSVRKVRHTGGNRLVGHARLRRDGRRFDDLGCEADGWDLQIVIFNGNEEEGVEPVGYPDKANALIESFRIHEVGDLTVPTVGKRRCRLESFERVESKEEVGEDIALISAKWSEDNEDDAQQQKFSAPSAASAASKQAEECSDAMDDSGPSLGDTLDDIQGAMEDLEGLANAPGEFVSDIETRANSVMSSVDKLTNTVSNAAANYSEEVATLFTDPKSARPFRLLARAEGTARRAVLLGIPGPYTRIVERRFGSTMTIFGVAREVGQDSVQLSALNGSLEDLLSIPANTPVRVFA